MGGRVFQRLAVSLILLLSACAGPDALEEGTAVAYRCADGARLSASYDGEEAIVIWQGRREDLARVISASGARYRNERVEWWTRGREGRLSSLPDGATLAYDCREVA